MCTHSNFTIVAYCPHWWERNQEGEAVRCKDCKALFHRWRPPLPELGPYRFEWLEPPKPSEAELAELIRQEREKCPVWQKEAKAGLIE